MRGCFAGCPTVSARRWLKGFLCPDKSKLVTALVLRVRWGRLDGALRVGLGSFDGVVLLVVGGLDFDTGFLVRLWDSGRCPTRQGTGCRVGVVVGQRAVAFGGIAILGAGVVFSLLANASLGMRVAPPG